MLANIPKGKWHTNQKIYAIIQNNIKLQDNDFDLSAVGASGPRWQRNVRNILQYRKTTGEIIWSGDGEYMIPDSTNPVAQTSSVSVGHPISEEAFRRLQELRVEIGQRGEEYVFSYEKNKLIKADRSDLASKVKRISSLNVGAGYDIESFEPDVHQYLLKLRRVHIQNLYLKSPQMK